MPASIILSLVCSLLCMHYDSRCDDQRLQQLVHKTQYVIVAEVVEVKPAPGFWSGQVAALQYVHYKVIKSLKGNPPDHIEVGHYVVKNSLSADKDRARLSPELFRVGNRLILIIELERSKHQAEPGKVKFISPDENCGAMLATEQSIQVVTRIING